MQNNNDSVLTFDKGVIARRAQVKLSQGTLPRSGTPQLWGGSGCGVICDVCEYPVQSAEITAEIQIDRSILSLHMHPQCYAIWEAERRAPREAPSEERP